MKKQYKIQLPKGKKVTFKEVHLNDGVLTIDVELTGKDENLGFSSRKEAEQFIREMDHINYVAWKKFIDKSKDIKEQKYEPKDGDFIKIKQEGKLCFTPDLGIGYSEKEPSIGIFKSIETDEGKELLLCYITLMRDSQYEILMPLEHEGRTFSVGELSNLEVSPATEEEKKLLINKLAEKGKRWNEKEKRIEDIEYIPEDGEFVHISTKPFQSQGYLIPTMGIDIIIKHSDDEKIYPYADSVFGIHIGNTDMGYYLSDIIEIRPCTGREKKILIDKLAKVNKKWNPETKRIEDVRWRANYGDHYYYLLFVDTDLLVTETTDIRMDKDDERYNSGNYFKTSEAAEKAAEQIRETFQNSKAE